MAILVTGACGHVGNNLVRGLIEEFPETKIVTFDLLYPKFMKNLPVHHIQGDIRDYSQVKKAFKDVRYVFHLAAKISLNKKDKQEIDSTNILGTENILRATKEFSIEKLIHFSSIHAICPKPFHETITDKSALRLDNDPYLPPYDVSKAISEKKVKQAFDEGLKGCIISPTGILGPYDFLPSIAGSTFVDLYHGRWPILVNGGFNWVDVRDVVLGSLAAFERGKQGEKYILAGQWLSLPEVAFLIEQVTGKKIWKISFPLKVAKYFTPLASLWEKWFDSPPAFSKDLIETLMSYRKISTEKAEKHLRFKARPIIETVGDTCQWFKLN